MKPLTPEQQAFAEEHHGLLLDFMAKHSLGDDYYDLLANRYLRVVVRYLSEEALRKYSFSTVVWYFDIVWSGKVGYIYISIDSCRGTVGDMDCLVIDSPEELLDKLLYEMAVDIMEEGGHDLNPVEASALERAEVARRLNVYLEQLPEYQDRISFVFERK